MLAMFISDIQNIIFVVNGIWYIGAGWFMGTNCTVVSFGD